MAKKSKVKKKIKKAVKKTTKKAVKKVATAAASRAALGAVPVVGPAAVALSVIASQMKPGSALSNFLNKSKAGGKSPGPKKKRSIAKINRETAPFKRKQKNIEANKQVRSIKEAKAATREAGRGGVMPKRTNVLRDKKGKIVKDKKGKPIKTGRGTAAFKKRMEERKRGGGK
tara:strand:- start:60 stop:575 length:516 start_codon:yes stop_codon:yes gene_type:complete